MKILKVIVGTEKKYYLFIWNCDNILMKLLA